MARRYSASQIRSKLRQAQQKQRQAVNKINQAIRRYNQGVRTYNSRVRANRQRLRSELNRLNRRTTTTRYVVYRTSVETLYESYTRLENHTDTQQLDPVYNRVLDLSEREAANSIAVTNRILGTDDYAEKHADTLEDAELRDCLRNVSADLDDRWQGAVFSLSPNNPDAARHFCTSAREIFTRILDITAPDGDVVAEFPHGDLTEQGRPTRRTKIRYLLHRKGMIEDTLEEFVENDLQNIVELFRVLNDGTHGSAGRFDFHQLAAVKKRVEDGIKFLTEIASGA
jgi:hypothetical protein